MSLSRSRQFYKVGIVSALAISGALAFSGNYALAQIRSDGTRLAESSVVKPNQQVKDNLRATPDKELVRVDCLMCGTRCCTR